MPKSTNIAIILLMILITLTKNLRQQQQSKETVPTMILFNGKYSCNPGTLNNMMGVYWMAYRWQQSGKTYEEWISVMRKYKYFTEEDDNGSSLQGPVNDWDVFGDLTSYYMLNAVGYFSPQLDQPIQLLAPQQQFPLTKKVGKTKAILTMQDVNAMQMTKIYGLNLYLNGQTNVMFEGMDTVNKETKQLIINSRGGMTQLKTNWFIKGQLKEGNQDPPKYQSEIAQQLQDTLWQEQQKTTHKQSQLKIMQYRHNHQTKLNLMTGHIYATPQQTVQGHPIPFWRWIYGAPDFNNDGYYEEFVILYYRQIQYGKTEKKDGVLIDLADVSYTQGNRQAQAIYPQQIRVVLFDDNQQYRRQQIISDPKHLLDNQTGLFLIQNYIIPLDPLFSLTIYYTFANKKSAYHNLSVYFEQNQFDIKVLDRVIKTPIKQQPQERSRCEYETWIEVDLFGEQRGKQFNGQKIMKLSTSFGMQHQKSFREGFEKYFDSMVQNLQGEQKVNKRKAVLQSIFESEQNYQILSRAYNEVDVNLDNSSRGYAIGFRSPKHNKTFQVLFDHPKDTYSNEYINQTHQKINFVNGFAKFRVKLNYDLDQETNPRTLVKRSFSIYGHIEEANSLEVHSDVNFACIFYQNTKSRNNLRPDWQHEVGPLLRMYSLIFPSMQKIVDMYNFQNISMDAMKRTFHIENTSDLRYMPANRQFGPIQHRRIRKWLYEPFYSLPKNDGGSKRLEYLRNLIKSKNYTNIERKKLLTQRIKSLWQNKIRQIPLLLSMIHKSNQDNIESHLRAIIMDEMKHVLILSNLLNSLSFTPSFKNHASFDSIWKTQQTSENLLKNLYSEPYHSEEILELLKLKMPNEFQSVRVSTESINDQDTISRIQIIQKRLALTIEERQKQVSLHFHTSDILSSIIDELWYLHDTIPESLFTGKPQLQLSYVTFPQIYSIFDLNTALNQLRVIVKDQDGQNMLFPRKQNQKKSHFLKLIEIFVGSQVSNIVSTKNTQKEDIFTILFNENSKKFKRQSENKVILEIDTPMVTYLEGMYEDAIEKLDSVFREAQDMDQVTFRSERTKKMEQMIAIIRRIELLFERQLRSNQDKQTKKQSQKQSKQKEVEDL